MQRLVAILKARYSNRNIGAIWADINTFTANIITFQTAIGFLFNESFTILLVNQGDGDLTFTLIKMLRINVTPVFITMMAINIFPSQNGIDSPTCGTDRLYNR